jgi:PKD repeat protein
VALRYHFHSAHAIASIAVDFEGDGTSDFTTTNPGATLQTTYNTPGTYTPRLSITDDQGTVRSATATVEVVDGAAMDAMFTGIWNGMNRALVNGEVQTALTYLSNSAKAKYAPVF